MYDYLERTEKLLGEEGLEKLASARVAVFGIGGVGGYAAEALARGGVGALDLIDKDAVSLSNLNRQIIALRSTIGRLKVDVMAERIRDINPEAIVRTYPVFYLPENSGEFDLGAYDYVIDAVDTVTAKLELVTRAKEAGIPIISCMGAGNKLRPEMFETADIYKTSVCPLAKVMRHELRARGIKELKVVFSKEEPRSHAAGKPRDARTPGSVSFAPGAAGLVLAGAVIRDLLCIA